MKRGILWMLLSFLLAASLVLASCAEAVPGEQEEEEEEEEEPVGEQEEEEEEEEEEEKVGPQYGGTFTYLGGGPELSATDPPSPAIADANWGALFCLGYIQEMPLIGDIEKYGPRGTGEFTFQSLQYIPDKYLAGNLLESWEVSFEKVVWNVRPGIYWAADNVDFMENRELTAEDVAADLTLFWESPWTGRFEGMIADIYTTGRYTLVIEFENYSPMLMYYIGYEDRAVIGPPETEAAGADRWENQVGTGPFMFEEYVVGSHMSFVRNPNYWRSTTVNGVEYQMPFIDRVVLPIIPDPSSQMAALVTGVVDYGTARSEQWDTIEGAAPELQQTSLLVNGTRLVMRCDVPPFNDVRVRQAVTIGTDMYEFQKLAMSTGFPMNWFPLLPDDPAYAPLEELPEDVRILYEYNPALAREMLAEAGYPEGFSTEFMFSTRDPFYADEAALLKDQWAKIGVEVELDPRDDVDYLRGRYSFATGYTWTGTMEEGLGAGCPLSKYLQYLRTGGPLNYSDFSCPEFDELVDRMIYELDPDENLRLAKEANIIVQRAVEAIPLALFPEKYYWWPWVKNYYGELYLQDDLSFSSIIPFIWIDQDLKAEMGY